MLDDGLPPLEALDAFGNFWHGKYDNLAGWVNRTNKEIPFLAENATAAANVLRLGCDSHLVDFGMPNLTTPDTEAAIGMERWNKAILFGVDKRYSITGAFEFGIDGWPYQCPDGTVWHLKAKHITTVTPATLGIYGVVLDPFELDEPSLLLTTAVIPSQRNGLPIVNFSPKGGNAASIHNYRGGYELNYLVDVSVSGGSAIEPPTVLWTLVYDGSSRLIRDTYTYNYTPDYQGVTGLGNPHVVDRYRYAQNDNENVWEIRQRDLLTGTVSASAGSPTGYTQIVEYAVAVVYGANGDRQLLSFGREDTYRTEDALGELTDQGAKQGFAVWYGVNSFPSISSADLLAIQLNSGRYKLTRSTFEIEAYFIARNGIRACEMRTQSVKTDTIPMRFDYNGAYPSENGAQIEGTPQHSGNGWNSSDVSVLDIATLRMDFSATNICVMWNETNDTMYGWVAPDYAQTYGAISPVAITVEGDVNLPTPIVAVNPVNGNFSPTTRRYF